MARTAVKVFKKARDKEDKDYYHTSYDDFLPYAVSSGVLVLLGAHFLTGAAIDILQCVYCPDLVAFKALRGLTQ